jgi:O-antigen ligase
VKAFALLAAAATVCAGLAADPLRTRAAADRALRQPVVWAAAALVLVASLATLTATDPWQSLLGHYPEYQGLLLLVASAVVGFGAYVLADDERGWRLIGRAAVIAVAVVSAYGLAQALGVDPVPSLLEFTVRRVRSTLGNASNLGVFLVMALPLVMARARAERAVWRWASRVALCAGATVLALSLSRGAWAGAFAGGVVWLLLEGRSWDRAKRLKSAGVAAAVAAVAVVLAVTLLPNAGARLLEVTDPSAGTPAWRLEVWSISGRMVAARPVLGYGPGSYRYEFPAYRTAATMAGEGGAQVLEDPHNAFASAAVAAGVAGLLAFLALVFGGLRAAWKPGDDPARPLVVPAVASALVGGLVALQFHFFTLDTAPLFAVLLGLAAGRAGLGSAPAALAPAMSATAAARWSARSVAAILAACAVLAGGLVLADHRIASGFGLVEVRAPWAAARAEFAAARSLAPWEPAAEWAMGRAATRWMSLTRDASAFADAEAAMLSTLERLPADPLAYAQTAETYLVGGLAARDSDRIRQSLVFSERAIALDPVNGYRWETKGTALAASGDTPGAIDAMLKAVGLAPGDARAWSTLATLYGRTGEAAKSADATRHALELDPYGTITP